MKSETAVLWMLDRETFSLIVKEASIKKREKYETLINVFIMISFLNNWELLEKMDDGYERMKMSDALGEM